MTEKTFPFLRRASTPAIAAGAAVAAAWAVVVASLAFAAAPRPAPSEALDGQAIPIASTSASSRPLSAGAVWGQLEKSDWIADGRKGAPRTVYVFTDPNCPYCNKLWADARPWVDAGKVQLRHVVVGILTPTSAGKAAALLSDKNPAAALDAYERGHVAANAKSLASGRPRPLGDDGLKPLAPVPPVLQARLDANAELMASYGMRATPALVWKDTNGKVQMSQGAPQGDLAAVYGPR